MPAYERITSPIPRASITRFSCFRSCPQSRFESPRYLMPPLGPPASSLKYERYEGWIIAASQPSHRIRAPVAQAAAFLPEGANSRSTGMSAPQKTAMNA